MNGKEPYVLEFNCRFGDPETQAVLPLLETDLADISEAIVDKKLSDIDIKWKPKAAVCIVLASGGYPLNYEKGKAIEIGQLDDGIILFHSGTVRGADGRLLTNGGRVLGVACVADDVYAAREKVYRNIPKIKFDAMHYRTDIARRETL
jgi:phosphoribosylamine--glycine ligase